MTFDEHITLNLSLIFNETGCIDKYYNGDGENTDNNNIKHIILIQSIDAPIKIGNNFLSYYHNLISIDASLLINVTDIGDHFLYDCYNLQKFSTIRLTSLISIGSNFLYNCRKLTNIDTSGLTNLTTIGNSFLTHCYNLTNIDISKLTSLITIGDLFLYKFNNNLTITIKNPQDCLHERLAETKYIIIQLYNKPCIYLNNNCII